MSQKTHNWGVWVAAGGLAIAILGVYKSDADADGKTREDVAKVTQRLHDLKTNLYRPDSMLPGARAAFGKVGEKLDGIIKQQVETKTNLRHIQESQDRQQMMLESIYRSLTTPDEPSGAMRP